MVFGVRCSEKWGGLCHEDSLSSGVPLPLCVVVGVCVCVCVCVCVWGGVMTVALRNEVELDRARKWDWT